MTHTIAHPTNRLACIILAIAGLYLLGSPTQAQDVNTDEKPATDFRTSFSCVIWEPLGYELFYYHQELYRPLKLPLKRRSELFEIAPNTEFLELFRQVTTEEGETVYQLAGRAPIVEKTDRILYFLSKNERDAEMPIRLFGIDDSLEAFPSGSFRFLNTTQVPLSVMINETKADVPPRGIVVVSPEIPKSGGFLPFYIADLERQKVIYQTRLYGQAKGRNMAFILIEEDQTTQGRVNIRFLSELIPDEQ